MIGKYLLGFLFIYLALATVSRGKWEKHSHTYRPEVRSRPSVSSVRSSGQVFFYGGMRDDIITGSTKYNDSWIYNSNDDAWEELEISGTKPPTRLFAPCAKVTLQDKFLIFGGGSYNVIPGTNGSIDFGSVVFYGDIWEMDLDELTWTEITPNGIAFPPLLGPEVIVKGFGRYIYIWGGVKSSFQDSNDLLEYDLLTNTLTLVNVTGSKPNGGHHPCLIDQTNPWKFIIAYRDRISGGVENDFWEFDIQTKTYTLLNMTGDVPTTRQYLTGTNFGNTWFGYGGDLPSNVINTSNTTGGTYRLDVLARNWTLLNPSGPVPPTLKRHRITDGAFAILPTHKSMIMVSGFSQNDDTDQEQVWNEDTWIFYPFKN